MEFGFFLPCRFNVNLAVNFYRGIGLQVYTTVPARWQRAAQALGLILKVFGLQVALADALY